MAWLNNPSVLLIWPYGVMGAESIPMAFSFLSPALKPVCRSVSVLDCSLNRLHPNSDEFIEYLKILQPDVIGISAWSQNWRWVQATIATIHKQLMGVPVILGGPHISATEDYGQADYALAGECEITLPQLVRALSNGAGNGTLELIPGLRFAGQTKKTPPWPVLDLDGLGLPNYDAMLLPQYQANGYRYRDGEKLQAPIFATRGCPYECAFCEAPIISGRRIRKHSLGYLKDLLIHLHDEYRVSHVNIVDDNFTFYSDYAKQFCEMVLQSREQLGDMTFATPNGIRVERSDSELFGLMKAAGWSRVIFAPESGSQRVVDLMAKHLDLGVVPDRVEMAHAADLEVEAFFILNYPGETDADVAATERFIARAGFDAVSLHVFKPLPGTPIWHDLIEQQQLSQEYVTGRYDEIDWLANGRTREDVHTMFQRLMQAARKSKERK
jgi:anaerobic magnesium-protoporphyrin IX monomethyl ester cyclase